ncbi:MAG: hypothetical protein IKC32_04685 [Clostridia bacterium]|nr:hypothetical protein [Clostridia bacterium]
MSEDNKKSSFGERLGDALLEILFSLLALGAGVGLLSLFGLNIDEIFAHDGDLVMLLGIVVIIAVGLAVFYILHLFKKWLGGKTKTDDSQTNEKEN